MALRQPNHSLVQIRPKSGRTAQFNHWVKTKNLDYKVMYEPAKEPNDLEKLFVERANAGDVEGLVALYEPDAILTDGAGEIAVGINRIREFFIKFLATGQKIDPSNQAEALSCGDLSLTSSRLSNGDITAEVARRQPDGNWLWVIDQFAMGKYK